MPKLLKFLAIHCAIGVTAGLAFLAILIVTDTAGLGTLIWGSANPYLALLLLAVGMAVTFGSAAMGGAVMMMPYNEDE